MTLIAPNTQLFPLSHALKLAAWEIRLEESEFLTWRATLNEVCLFFDGASKGNPGVVGGGGVLLSTDGTIACTYSWGLGVESNNIVESCGLWQGLTLALSKGITNLTVFGDSRILIQALTTKRRPSHLKMALTYQKILLLTKKFQTIRFLHVLRGMNSLADREANRGTLLGRSTLQVDGIDSRCDIP